MLKSASQIYNDILTVVNSEEFNNDNPTTSESTWILADVLSLLRADQIEKALLELQNALDYGWDSVAFINYLQDQFGDGYTPSWVATVSPYPTSTW